MSTWIPESREVQEHGRLQQRAATMRLLEKRVRARLGRLSLVLKKSRGARQKEMFGAYWVRHEWNITPILHHVHLPTLARQAGVFFADLHID